MNILGWLFGRKKHTERQSRKIENRRSHVYNLYFVQGHTQEQIAKILGADERTIRRDVKYLTQKSPLPTTKSIHAVAFRKRVRKSIKDFTVEEMKQVKKLRLEGKKLREIADMTGSTIGVVSYIQDKEKYHTRYTQREYRKEHLLEVAKKAHQKKTPSEYHELCPACNKSSPLTWEIWVKLQRTAKINKLNGKAFDVKQFLMQNGVFIENPIKVVEGIGNFIPVTRNEILQRPPEEPKGGYVI